MIKVIFYGLARIKTGVKEVTLDKDIKNMKECLYALSEKLENFSYNELKKYVLFVNGKNITDLKMYRTKLKNGDIVQFMSPVSGG